MSINQIYSAQTEDSTIISDFESLSNVAQAFLDTPVVEDLVQEVVNRVLHEVGKLDHEFHIAVLALVDESNQVLKRISISETTTAEDVQGASDVGFKSIETPLLAEENYCIRAMIESKHFLTHNFTDILRPPFTKEECMQMQKAGNIGSSVVFPIIVKNKSIGIVIFSTQLHIDQLTFREVTFIKSLTNIIGIAVENSRLFKELQREKVALKEANKKLLKLDKIKDEFVSIASHELRTPMTIIKNYLWMLKAEKAGDLNERQHDYLDKAQRSVERMLSLINDMLDVSRMDQGRMVLKVGKVNIVPLAEDIFDSFKIQFKEKGLNLDLVNVPQRDKIYVSADAEKLREVITNLISNAYKYTDEGSVRIEMDIIPSDVKAKISIKDTGRGISKEDIPRLFKKFSRLGDSYSIMAKTEGTGLGLYISHSLIGRMGGELNVESELGKGSTFWITLPLAKKDDEEYSII